ncbi:hypothetical protein DFH29DRAFT_1001676 [Suillus ampliporus]|nr:hypothetical protein DFH29DRAFT_1001676 [Suillus ampliporus]
MTGVRLTEVALIKSIEQEVCLGMECEEDTLLRVIRDVIAAVDEGGESCILDIRIPECVKEGGVTEGLLERAQRDWIKKVSMVVFMEVGDDAGRE